MGYLTGWQEAEEFLNNLRSDSLRAKLKHGIGKCPLGQHLVIMKDGTSYCRHNPDSEPDTGFKLSPKAKLGIATALVGGTALAIGATVLNKKKPAFEPTPSPVTEKVEEVKTPPPQEPDVEKENETPVTENAQEVSSPPPKKPKAKKKTPATNVVDEQVTEPPQPPQQKRGRGRPKKEKPPVDPNKPPVKKGRPPLNKKPSATISPDGSTEKQSKTKVSDRSVEPVTNKEPVNPTPAPSKLLATLVPKLKEIDASISDKDATKVIQSELKTIKSESDKFNKLKIEADKKIRDFGDKPTPTQKFSLQLDLDAMARLENTEKFIPFKDKLIPTGLNLIGKPLPTPTSTPTAISPPVPSVTTPEKPSLVTTPPKPDMTTTATPIETESDPTPPSPPVISTVIAPDKPTTKSQSKTEWEEQTRQELLSGYQSEAEGIKSNLLAQGIDYESDPQYQRQIKKIEWLNKGLPLSDYHKGYVHPVVLQTVNVSGIDYTVPRDQSATWGKNEDDSFSIVAFPSMNKVISSGDNVFPSQKDATKVANQINKAISKLESEQFKALMQGQSTSPRPVTPTSIAPETSLNESTEVKSRKIYQPDELKGLSGQQKQEIFSDIRDQVSTQIAQHPNYPSLEKVVNNKMASLYGGKNSDEFKSHLSQYYSTPINYLEYLPVDAKSSHAKNVLLLQSQIRSDLGLPKLVVPGSHYRQNGLDWDSIYLSRQYSSTPSSVTPKQSIENNDLSPVTPTSITPDASNKKTMTFNDFINGANSSKMGQIYDGDNLLGDVIISKGTGNYADKLIVKLQGGDRKTFTSAPFNMGYNSSIDDVQSTVSDYFSTDNPSYNIKWREYSPPKTTAPNNKKPSTPTPILVPQKDMVQAGNGTFTGNPEHDSRLALYQQFQSQGQSLTFAQEKSIEIYTRRAKADPSKWQVGQGVAYKVGQQINRGFQISQIDPDTKLALLSQVADTGLTVTGSSDKLPPSWVHIGDLVTDNSYNSSPSSVTPTSIAPDSSIPKETEEIDLGSTDSFELPNGQINKSLYRIKKTGSFDKGYEYALEEKTLRSNDGITFEDAGWIPFSYGESPQQALTSFLSGHTRNFDLVQNNSILVQEAKQNASSIISSKLQAQSDLHRSQQLKSAQKSLLSSTEVLDVFSSIDQSQLDAKQKQNLKARIKETTQKIEEAQSLIASLSSPQNPPSPPVPSVSIPDEPTSSPLSVNPAIAFPLLDPVKLSEELTTLKSTPDGLFLGSVSTVKDRITEYRVRLSKPNEATKPYILESRHINNDRPYPWSPLNFNDTPDAAIASYMALNPNHNLGAITEKTQLHLKAEQSQERIKVELANQKLEREQKAAIVSLDREVAEQARLEMELSTLTFKDKGVKAAKQRKLTEVKKRIEGYKETINKSPQPLPEIVVLPPVQQSAIAEQNTSSFSGGSGAIGLESQDKNKLSISPKDIKTEDEYQQLIIELNDFAKKNKFEVGFNHTQGYYISTPLNTDKGLLPEGFEMTQTLINTERWTNSSLLEVSKQFENFPSKTTALSRERINMMDDLRSGKTIPNGRTEDQILKDIYGDDWERVKLATTPLILKANKDGTSQGDFGIVGYNNNSLYVDRVSGTIFNGTIGLHEDEKGNFKLTHIPSGFGIVGSGSFYEQKGKKKTIVSLAKKLSALPYFKNLIIPFSIQSTEIMDLVVQAQRGAI